MCSKLPASTLLIDSKVRYRRLKTPLSTSIESQSLISYSAASFMTLVMAPSFLKDLRRRSRASFRTQRSTDGSTDSSSASNGTVPTTKSSSTLNSTYGSQTPPTAVQSSNSSTNMQINGAQVDQVTPLPVRPQVLTNTASKRQSVSGMTGLGSPSSTIPTALPASPFAPRITSISDGAWVRNPLYLFSSMYETGCLAKPSSSRSTRKCSYYMESSQILQVMQLMAK